MALFDESEEEQDEPSHFRASNNGSDKRKNKTSKPKKSRLEARRALKKSPTKALKAEDMYLHEEERQMVTYEYNRAKEALIEKYGEFTAFMEYEVVALCYALVRLRRKSRLESNFSRFFDRVVPHDPLGQVTSIVKALGMLPDKKEQESAGASQEIRKILAADSEENEALASDGGSNKVDYETWLKSQDVPVLQMRTPTVLPRYDDEQKLPENDEEEQGLNIEKINGDAENAS